jgi:tRNA-Thr(GGU) m(6)t(6)A37 methyltransferase TsaA
MTTPIEAGPFGQDTVVEEEKWCQEYAVRPAGFVHNELDAPSLVAGDKGLSSTQRMEQRRQQMEKIAKMVSTITIRPDLAGILDGLDGFSHALILYWPHLAKAGSREIVKVHPMGRKDMDEVGIFASCSPARPNPILVTAARVLTVEATTLKVRGLEAVNGSPVLDIKPYNRHYLVVDDLVMADWMEEIDRRLQR